MHGSVVMLVCWCAATAPQVAPATAVAAAVVDAATAPAPGPGVASSQPMSSVLSITAPMAAEATVISDIQEAPSAANRAAASAGPMLGADVARRAGVGSFQQRSGGGPGGGGPGGGGPRGPGGRGPWDGPPLPLPGGPLLPGPTDNSVSSRGPCTYLCGTLSGHALCLTLFNRQPQQSMA